MTDRKRHGLILLVVIGLIAASVVVIATMPTRLGLDLKGGVELVYEAQPTPQSPVDDASIARAIDVMDDRVNQLGVSQAQIQQEGHSLIDVQIPSVHNVTQAEQTVGKTARLAFYDWEANLITPSGTTVADLLKSGISQSDASALAMSQGSSSSAPGGSSATVGGMGFYSAVELASKQPYKASQDNAQDTQYYLFGAPGSSNCQAWAAANHKTAPLNVHCLIASDEPTAGTAYASAVSQLKAGLTPAEVNGAQVLVVKRGTIVLQAAPSNFSRWPSFGSISVKYYVLRDHAALFGNEVTNPQQSTDESGAPDVSFGFTSKGASAFQRATKQIADRGAVLSLTSKTKYPQHFAAVLDNQILSVPSIDFNTNPDGISGSQGVEIYGSFTTQSAQQLATQLRIGALPIKLVRISESQVSATLGSQALHQGLIAGLIGLGIVALFLIAYYRLLGVIAVAGLITYGIYFYSLIKLIPITLTLAGIAGLVLTIGVAADANVVIFERVKEEVRAGRSVRQAIATGYKKGLTAIIDGNVVTIMTAFILFVLATSDVKGFAFTLGIGTIVSLFTAVLATQATLLTLRDSRALAKPAALGAARQKRPWRFDFMGAGRYFFTMSGVILLVGSIAIGTKGLNLGIDFTSGTQISASLNRSANVSQIKSMVNGVGGGGTTTVQAVNGGSLGRYGVQISLKYLNQSNTAKLRNELQAKYGTGQFNTTVIGPTFGSAVAKSAIIALIVSLALISIYITLRFDRKYAVPVLIALMHDLLITAGVYALTGKAVSTDTVAALLTILGYSIYDTIIVFDRVRENVPRMPRAAFSQIVNRSMSEVLTRSLVTTSCTLLPVVALLIFGGSTLQDFAFALLIGVASGAYSSIFIASPVLTHWKEREAGYRARRARIIEERGFVPAYASGGDVEPVVTERTPRERLTVPGQEGVSNAEFEQMTSELGLDDESQGRTPARGRRARGQRAASPGQQATAPSRPAPAPAPREPERQSEPKPAAANPAAQSEPPAAEESKPRTQPSTPAGSESEAQPPAQPVRPDQFEHAPDVAENEGVADVTSGPSAPHRRRQRNRNKHGRRR